MPKRAKPEAAAMFVPEAEQPYKIPDNWRWARIGAVADLYTGNSINEKVKKQKYEGNPEGYLYIATKDISFDSVINYETNIRIPERDAFKVAPPNTALLCIEGGSAGRKIGFVNQAVCFVNKLCAFRTSTVHSKYVFYFLQTHCFESQFLAKKHGLIGGVPIKALSTSIIPVAPLAEQQRIVERIESLFTKLDAAREKAQAVVDGFELRKAAILHRAFTGELTAQWRAEHGASLNSWQNKKLSDISCLQSGLMKGKRYKDSHEIALMPYLRVANVQDGFLNLNEIKRIEVPKSLINRYLLKEGDVLFTEGGDFDKLGRGTVWRGEIKDCLHQNHVFVVRTDPTVLIPAFLSLQAGSLYGKQYFLRCSKQTVNLASINSTQLKNFPVILPCLAEQGEIVRLLEHLLSQEQHVKEAAEVVLVHIDMMKRAILGRAFRGELGTNDPSEASPDFAVTVR